jgi:N-acyl amino acid synthase of PEP-CTERM/exosortase system
MTRLAQNFSHYFRVVMASTRQQKRYAHAIRYQVYAKEMGWEPPNESRLEIDECDEYATHCLLEHKRSGEAVGCIRIVIPPAGEVGKRLPCQTHDIALDSELAQSVIRGEVGEISRLAVPHSFRHCTNESIPAFSDSHDAITYSDEERRNFSHISLGLYYASIAMAEFYELEQVLVCMEPRLNRCLARFGLKFHQMSKTFEMKGKERALFVLHKTEFSTSMKPAQLELYQNIHRDMIEQFQPGHIQQPTSHEPIQLSNRVL